MADSSIDISSNFSWCGVGEGIQKLEMAMTNETEALLIERGKSYGTFAARSVISQQLKDLMKRHKGWEQLAADQRESLEMIVCKLSRILNGDPNHADSWVDIAGYAKLVSDRLKGVQR